jgi:thiamine pyrophosphokinase
MDAARPAIAVIFANGDIGDYAAARQLVQPGDFLVAADGGLRHLQTLNLRPNLLIGDLDSVTAEDVAAMQSAGVEIRRFPVEKDETDLELAMLAVASAGWRTIRVAGGLGGRLDQTLGNLFLLMLPGLASTGRVGPGVLGLDLRLDDGREEAWLVRGLTTIDGCAGDVVSLLPLNGPVSGIVTQGLQYPLQHETLYPEHTRGISNVMQEAQASVSLEKGLLLCIHTRKSMPDES